MLQRLRSTLFRRNVTIMATTLPKPTKPLLVILGSTGTGKSDLAVELALRFRGEIINADAMQLYKGLPIITNKMPEEERMGIPHHLLDHVSLHEEPWAVDDFKREADQVIEAIRERGNLPILVGGTQYYVNPLLFPEVTLDDVQDTGSGHHAILDEPTEVILEELRRVDPAMAERWHPNDRRKISRSLQIYLQSGRTASELYAEQVRRKAEVAQSGAEGPWENLLFWVYAEREPLKTRLDRRVDKMVDGGLLEEIKALRDVEHRLRNEDATLDLTKGIWQSIGYKQFEAYQTALGEGREPAELEQLKSGALDDMKAATRRYANYQTKWITKKQVPLLKEQGETAVNSLYLLDSTDISSYKENVVTKAIAITEQFLKAEPRPLPSELSNLAREVLGVVGEDKPKQNFVQRTCELCGTVAVTEQAWNQHVRGTAHRRVVKKRKRLALVPVADDSEPRVPDDRKDGPSEM